MKRNEGLTCATAWVSLENTLSGRRQTQKVSSVRFHLHEIPRTGKSVELESRFVGAYGWGVGGGEQEVTVNGYRFRSGDKRKF